MTKIFLVIPTLKQGGAERIISELANSFVKKDNTEVHLVLLAKANDFYITHSNVIIHRLGFENKGRLHKVISELNTLLSLRNLLKKHNPTTVLSFMDKYNVFTLIASIGLRIPVYISDRSNPKKVLPASLQWLKKIIYPRAAGIIAQTSLAKNILELFTQHPNIKVIPNPIKEIKLYSDTKREKIILNVGRLVPEKGQKYLLEAFSKSKAHDWKLVILGDGPLRQELENQAIELGIQSRVEMPGAVKDVDRWYAKASLFVFSSISEGFPNALVEAMAAGLPVISFDCDAGPQDFIIQGKNGILVPTEDTKVLVEWIDKMVCDALLREQLGRNAQLISKHLELNKICNRYFNFLISAT